MKVFLTCKLSNTDAYYTIKPITDLSLVHNVIVFRDNTSDLDRKINYVTTNILKPKIFKFVYRFYQMIRYKNDTISLVIGIYEIPHGFLAFVFGKIFRIPVVINLIGNPAYDKLRKGIRKKVMFFMLKRIEAIAVTGSKSKMYLKSKNISEKNIFCLPNCIDVKYYIPKKKIKCYDILGLARFDPDKEIVNFVKIINEIVKIKPDVKVAIAGDGPEKSKIIKEIKELSLNDNIILLGIVDKENLNDFYSSGKVFISCSSTEGLPRGVILSMSCGIPCIASNVGDMEDLIIDYHNGFLIDSYDDFKSFAQKTIKLLKNEKLYNKFSKNSRSHVVKYYSFSSASQVWLDIINKIYNINI